MAGLAQYSEFFANPVFSESIRALPVATTLKAGTYLPRQDTFDTTFYESVVKRQQDMAGFTSQLAESPLTDRDPMRTVSGEIADISQGYMVTKQELGALMDRGNAQRREIVETQLLNKAAQIRANVDARIDWMGWKAMSEGEINYAQNGIILSVDFNIPASNKKTAVTPWGDADAPILENYEAWVQEYIDLNGVGPEVFETSTKVIRAILNQTNLRKLVTGYSDKLLTLDELNTFLDGRQMPRISKFDSQVTYRDPNTGTRTTERLLDPNKGVFLRSGGEIGNQLMGPTIDGGMNPGIFAETIDLILPKRTLINVVAASFPKITNPDLIMPATVLV